MSRRSEQIIPPGHAGNTVEKRGAHAWQRIIRGSMAGVAALLLAAAGAQAQSLFGPEPVGTASSSQDVTVTATTAGTVSSVEALTQGAPGLDFAVGTGTSTCSTATLALNATCTEPVTFTPSAPGTRLGAVVLLGMVSGVQTVLGTAYIQGTGTGSLGVLVPGNVIPVAGQTDVYLGSVQDGKTATAAVLYLPMGEALDGAGNLYIADSAHNRIRMVCASATSALIEGTTCTGANIISTIAGNGNPGNSGNGSAAASTVDDPSGVAIDGAGNVFIADTGNNVIREIVAATGQIVTVAGGGTGCAGQTDSVGDGCTALPASLNQPLGVTLDPSGNIFIADTADERIREVTLSTGLVTTAAGDGFTGSDGTGGYNGDNITAITAELNTPYAVAFDAAGNMYIPDSGNNRIRLVTAVSGAITPASIVTTFAGNGTQGFLGDNAAAKSAELWAPSGVALDAAGNLYIADTQNQAIRKVSAATLDITTLVKNGVGSVYFNNSFGKTTFYGPTGIYLDGSGNLYIADTLDMVVREIQSNFVALDYTTAVRQGSNSAAVPVTIENDGNADLDLTAITPSTNALADPATTTCIAGPPDMVSSTTCIVGAVFAPTVSGNPLTANIDVTSLTVNSPLNIELVGDALAVNSTTTTVTSTPNPSAFGQIVTFTVTVTTGSGTGNLTGTVSLADTFNGVTTNLASGLSINASGVASFQISTLAVGQHSIVAAYAGDTGHFASTSIDNGVPPLIQTVMEGTKITLTSSVNPSAPGQSVTFTATVATSAGGGVTPDGTVTFMDGTTVLNTVPLAAGVATYATSTLTIGVHPITAVYSGDATNQIAGSTSAVLNQDVRTASTVVLTSSLNPSTFGTAVTFTATVTSSSTAPPTGTVSFYDGTTKIGTGTLSGNPAAATYALITLSVGTHSMTAVYAGDSNNGSSTSPVLSQVVNQVGSTVAITSAPNPSNFGQGVTFTVTVTAPAGSGNLNGAVSIADTFNGVTTTLASALSVNTSGVATFQSSTLAVGQHSIVATYNGDTNHASSSAAPLIQSVIEATVTTVTSSLNPSVFGQSVTFTATVAASGAGGVTPDGTVTFMDGATALGTGTLTAGVATYSTTALAVGMHSITAVYAGDSANGINPSTSAVLKQDVQAATTVVLVSSLNPSNFGLTVTFTATVSSSATSGATGTVVFLDNGKQIGTGTLAGNPAVAAFATSTLAVGTHPITATYAGDANNGAGATAAPLSQVVSLTQTATTVAAVPNPGIANEAVAITATVKVTSGAATPTGTVTFTSGTTALGTAALSAAGTANINPVLAAGNYQIVATYSGDADNGGSVSAALSLTVSLATSTTTLTVSPNPAQVGASVTFTSSVAGNGVAATGTVSFFNGTTMLGTGTVNGAGTATFATSTLAVGNYSITAVYSGDVNNSPSTSAAVSLTVGLIPTTTSLATSSTTGPNPQTILIAVVIGNTGSTPTGTVTFTNGTTTIGSGTLDSSGVVTLTPNLPTGNYSIVASYGGDATHAPSKSAPVSITGAPAGFSLTVNPATLSLKTSQNGSVTVNLVSAGGFTDTIGLGCGSLPAGVTCTFASNPVTLAANGSTSTQLIIDTNTPLGGGATAMNSRGTGTGGPSLAGLFLPFSAFFGWLFWRLRKRTMSTLTVLLVLALSAGALVATGCSGYSSSTAKPGTYVIQVTGTGTTSDVIHYQNVSLTITN